ncbi:GAF domain-containing protein [Candidatus Cloacimonadota bacterium]
MNCKQKRERYRRIYKQLKLLFQKVPDPIARMSTVAAVLHHKFDYYFWTGFYTLKDGELIVGPYQGPVACLILEKDKGVCWAGINQKKTIIVPDVEKFPDHIACDNRSRSEIVIPLSDHNKQIFGVLDVDSKSLDSFDEIDKAGLEQIVKLIFS